MLRRNPFIAIALTVLTIGWLALADPATARFGSWWQKEDSSQIAFAELPPEARQVIETIRRGGPFAYPKDGVVFGNRERLLPRQPRGYYTEYTVRTPGVRGRGARRLIVGGVPAESAEIWYSDDHYQSFRRIRE